MALVTPQTVAHAMKAGTVLGIARFATVREESHFFLPVDTLQQTAWRNVLMQESAIDLRASVHVTQVTLELRVRS